MSNQKDNLFLVNAEDLILGVDFEVVTDTPFDADRVRYFFRLDNHDIDYELAITLGLGVVKNLFFEDDFYIYNASNDHADHFGLMNVVMRMDVYYQITHPEYDNKKLEEFIIGTERGKKFLEKLQTVDTDVPYKRLKQVFDSKKGNVIQFKRSR